MGFPRELLEGVCAEREAQGPVGPSRERTGLSGRPGQRRPEGLLEVLGDPSESQSAAGGIDAHTQSRGLQQDAVGTGSVVGGAVEPIGGVVESDRSVEWLKIGAGDSVAVPDQWVEQHLPGTVKPRRAAVEGGFARSGGSRQGHRAVPGLEAVGIESEGSENPGLGAEAVVRIGPVEEFV